MTVHESDRQVGIRILKSEQDLGKELRYEVISTGIGCLVLRINSNVLVSILVFKARNSCKAVVKVIKKYFSRVLKFGVEANDIGLKAISSFDYWLLSGINQSHR